MFVVYHLHRINIVFIQYFVKYISSRKKDCPSQSFFHHLYLQTSHGNSSIFSKATCSSGVFPLNCFKHSLLKNFFFLGITHAEYSIILFTQKAGFANNLIYSLFYQIIIAWKFIKGYLFNRQSAEGFAR